MNDLFGRWQNIGLQLKLQLLIQGFLLLILLAAQLWLSQHLEQREIKAAHERITAVADGALNGLNTLMSVKIDGNDVISDIKSRALFIKQVGNSDKLKELRVVRAKALIDEFGPGLTQEQALDALDRNALASGKPQYQMATDQQGVTTLRAVFPSIARSEFRGSKCLKCHAVSDGAVLGAISVTVDITDDLADGKNLIMWLWIGQGVLQVLLFFVIGQIVHRALKPLGAEPHEATQLAQNVARGDLSHDVVLQPGDAHSMMAQLKFMQSSLAKVVGHVHDGAEGVATASVEIAQGNSDLSSRTENQACSLEETAASMMELDQTVKKNADNAQQANRLAQSASEVAVQGGAVVSEVVVTMRGINESSHKISEIISVIDGIAFQTNILALNAAVEAARAGEQGRGFAVVATEVRSLAGRSAQAAREIKSLIDASVERVEQGSALVDKAGATMQEVVNSIAQVTQIMGDISQASAAQSSGVAQVVEAIREMDQSTQQNAALVEQMAAAAAGLNTQAQELVHAVAVFKLK